jgi:hypothetical protein
LSVVGCRGRGDAAEVSVFEAVAVSFQGDDFGVVDETVDHGGSYDVVAEDLAPANRGWDMFGLSNLGWCLGCLASGVSADL